MSVVAGTCRDALRAATGELHERLHHVPAFAALAAGRLTRDDYIAMLRRKLGFHRAVEAGLATAPDLSPFGISPAERRRVPMLEADLAALGADAVVPIAPIPAPGSAAGAMGWLYVSEGSTLGGRQLARGLDDLLGQGEPGRRFLLGHGERHGAMWRDCCAAIERCGADPQRLAAMQAGAVAAFQAFEAWFIPAPTQTPTPAPAPGIHRP